MPKPAGVQHGIANTTDHQRANKTARGVEAPRAVMISHSMNVVQAFPSPVAIIVIMSRQRLA